MGNSTDPQTNIAQGTGLLAGGAAAIPLGIMAGNVSSPQYSAPSMDQSSQNTLTNMYGAAGQTPAQIAASQVNPAMAVGKQAAASIGGSAQRSAMALGMSDPSNVIGAINSRLQRNISGQMGNMALSMNNQAQVESAERLSQAIGSGLDAAKMANAISMNQVQSYQNQLVARQQVIAAITGGSVQALGGGAMMQNGLSRRKGSPAMAATSPSPFGLGSSDLPSNFGNVA